jgi:hypothetical protein
MVVLGVAASLTVAVLDLVITGGLSLLFDLAYVALCVALALRVRPRDFFTVGVLPPLLMLGVVGLLGLFTPGSIADDEAGTFQAVLTGLADHAGALAAGYALCLACLAIRRSVVQGSKRSGSPAPRRRRVGVPSE